MRNESGKNRDMTLARPWPNEMKDHRDRAAELLVSAERKIDAIIDDVPELNAVMVDIQKALRHLEKAGAQTRPE